VLTTACFGEASSSGFGKKRGSAASKAAPGRGSDNRLRSVMGFQAGVAALRSRDRANVDGFPEGEPSGYERDKAKFKLPNQNLQGVQRLLLVLFLVNISATGVRDRTNATSYR
jgi:hypothetical protein